MKRINFNIMIYLLFFLLILGATMFYGPGWGLMDDFGHISKARMFWQGEYTFSTEIEADIQRGRFRPVYYLWVFSVYAISNPVIINCLMVALVFLTLLIWGKTIGLLWKEKGPHHDFYCYVFPLTFFIFTPFWNNFMYISLQEKFLFIFGGLSLYFFVKSYRADSSNLYWVSLIFLTISIFAKETSVAYLLIYPVYAVLDLVLFKKNRNLSILNLTVSSLLFVTYYIFIQSLLKSYTAKYDANSNPLQIFINLFAAIGVVKFVFLIALFATGLFIGLYMQKRVQKFYPEYVLFPLFLMVYILLLAPWGYMSYLLAPLAPCLWITLLPAVDFLMSRNKFMKVSIQGGIVVLTLLVVTQIDLPNIERMANIRNTLTEIEEIKVENRHQRFFYPAPYLESAVSIRRFTETDLYYLNNGNLDQSMLRTNGDNYLVVDIQAAPIDLNGVELEKLVYENSTWKIYELSAGGSSSSVEKYKADFELNPIQKLKDYIKQI